MTTILSAIAIGGALSCLLNVVIILAIVGVLFYCIETFIGPVPPPIRICLAIILAIILLIWALGAFHVT